MDKDAQRFEDLISWQKARLLNQDIYNLTTTQGFADDAALKNQVRRAAIAILLNIAEAFVHRQSGEFREFLYVAQGSTAEVQSALYVAKDRAYISEEEFKITYDKVEELSKLISKCTV